MARRVPALRQTGFSMVELAITIAVIGILASIAIPGYQRQQWKAKRAEGRLIVNGISTAEQAYHASNDNWVATGANPAGSIGKDLRTWDMSISGWSTLNFQPDGEVRCNYQAQLFGTVQYCRVSGTCDVDDDNAFHYDRFYIPSDSPDQSTIGWTETNPRNY